MSDFKALKERVYRCNMELERQGIVKKTFGNASCIDRNRKIFAIKPSGVPYEELSPEKMVIVDLDNNVIEGDLNPSTDTKTHSCLYSHFLLIGGVVHTHSTFAVAWAQAKKPIPVFGTTHADFTASEIPCTKVMSDKAISGDYEIETGRLIVRTFKNLSYREIQMVLVACHGPFTWGETPEKAVDNSIMLEEIAKTACITLNINPYTKHIKNTLIRKHHDRKHGSNAYYGQYSGRSL
ncbi:MAG: L-ribulose-5-phosphate 4-epimerase AraD [Spirochaetales bacterium]|nr:L-ribulose-5-phosphate 4-epimerase AraD [Spirochaetales bacterium]